MRERAMSVPETAIVCQKLTEIAEISASLFTIQEFCAATRISQRQFFRIQAAGEGPRMIWLGGRKLISRSALDSWLREHEER
jgi:predicted DNA-binding transcriptional regulator AlpA